jgi:hypothetical protein
MEDRRVPQYAAACAGAAALRPFMELTAFQRRTLEDWRRMKPDGLTWKMGLRRLVRTWSLLLALVVVASLLFPQVWMLLVGLAAGSCLRDLGYVRSARAVWPVSFRVIDWAKVDELLTDSKSA